MGPGYFTLFCIFLYALFTACNCASSFMEEKDKNLLYDLGPEILELLNINVICPYLFKQHLATSAEQKEYLLSSPATPTEKKNKLIFIWLQQKGDDSLSRFIEALKESANEEPTHETLASKITAKRAEGLQLLHDL